MNAGYFVSWATLGEAISIVLLIVVIAGQFRIRRGIKRIEDRNPPARPEPLAPR